MSIYFERYATLYEVTSAKDGVDTVAYFVAENAETAKRWGQNFGKVKSVRSLRAVNVIGGDAA